MQDILYLYDAQGKLCGVQLPPAMWERVKKHLPQGGETQSEPETSDALEAWEEFKQYWDFKYPFRADVKCLHCGTVCDDWEHDPKQRFHLRVANLGGLLVFRCSTCGAAVRKKHFKDHVVFEVTPKG